MGFTRLRESDILRSSIKKFNQIRSLPNTLGSPGGHSWSNAQSLMDADEVVVHIMKGDSYLLSTRGAKNGLNGLLPRVTCALSFLLRAFQVKRHLAVKRPILPNTG